MKLLESIGNPLDIRQLNIESLKLLTKEVRDKIISVTEKNGGHLASSLGAVDGIISLLKVFDFSKDKIIFDVGHQAYAYKILTERRDDFDTIRQNGGISGFPLISESKYDSFSSGHAGDSLAAALGYCGARDKLEKDYNVIVFIGDASFVNGENLEALFAQDKKPKKLLVVLNDNGMSISKNGNGLYKLISSMALSKNNIIDGNHFMESVGFKYKTCDGHDIEKMCDIFTDFSKSGEPTIVQITTQKGKGYLPAEISAENYHGVSKDFNLQSSGFSSVAGALVNDAISKNDKVVAIVAGMAHGTGIDRVKDCYPNNFVDVGISEDFAVTYAAGLALGGLKPIVCIYSTFLQRAYDQIITNVCLQNLPVIFLIDRAGAVGADGYTHQGVFDLSYLSHIPNLKIFTPKDDAEFSDLLNYALSLNSPVAIRYPNGNFKTHEKHLQINDDNLWEIVKEGSGKVVLACGSRALNIAIEAFKNSDCAIVNARSVKPIDRKILNRYFDRDFITVEDNVLYGGFASQIALYLCSGDYKGKLKNFAFGDEFIPHATVEEQFESFQITVEELRKYIK